MSQKFADLHLHTLFSDGVSTPLELVLAAKAEGLGAISVVDHDTVDGLDSLFEAGESEGLEVIPGVELTAESNGSEIHILGYLIDYENKKLRENLHSLKDIRVERLYKILAKLKNMGIELKDSDVLGEAKKGTVGRLHIARAMLEKRFVNSIPQAFKKYIGDKCPAYVAGFKFSPREAIQFIKEFGGIPILAHPYLFNIEAFIEELITYGIMGLEVYYPEHTPGLVNSYLALTQKFNLLSTGGSDFHGDTHSATKVGSVKIPYELVEKLKAAKAKCQ